MATGTNWSAWSKWACFVIFLCSAATATSPGPLQAWYQGIRKSSIPCKKLVMWPKHHSSTIWSLAIWPGQTSWLQSCMDFGCMKSSLYDVIYCFKSMMSAFTLTATQSVGTLAVFIFSTVLNDGPHRLLCPISDRLQFWELSHPTSKPKQCLE